MNQYNFNKTVSKIPAFDDYLRKQIDSTIYDGVTVSSDNVMLGTYQELSPTELTRITGLINDYVDPIVFLQYNHTESYPAYSEFTNTITPSPHQTLIFVNRNSDNQVLDACKTILTYATDDVSLFQNVEHASITFSIYDITRDYEIASQTVDISSDILQKWKTQGTGSNKSYKTIIFTGRSVNPINP